jgi:hypothetical protein
MITNFNNQQGAKGFVKKLSSCFCTQLKITMSLLFNPCKHNENWQCSIIHVVPYSLCLYKQFSVPSSLLLLNFQNCLQNHIQV